MPEHAFDTDILIAGGGLVGAALAVALRDTGLKITVAEAVPFRTPGQPSYDDRSTALSYGSRRILETMGVWESLSADASPIRQVHVSQKRRLGITRLSAEEENQPALGYVVPNRTLGKGLMAALEESANIDLRAPARVAAIDANSGHVSLLQEDEQHDLRARMIVVADGAKSPLREMLGVNARHWNYGQTAIVCNVTPELPHKQVAYERFTPEGPLALLPLDRERMALVLVEDNAIAADVAELDDEQFLARLAMRFGKRLGSFASVGKRSAYPLSLVTAAEQVKSRAVILGNAAHSLHPIAGQGFNLSLRDVATLADVIIEHRDTLDDVAGACAALEAYASWRRQDQRKVVYFTDLLNRLFMLPFSPAAHARGIALLGLDLLPTARTGFAHHAMGKAGRLPRLARGLKLG